VTQTQRIRSLVMVSAPARAYR